MLSLRRVPIGPLANLVEFKGILFSRGVSTFPQILDPPLHICNPQRFLIKNKEDFTNIPVSHRQGLWIIA